MAADDLIGFGTLKVLCPNLGKVPHNGYPVLDKESKITTMLGVHNLDKSRFDFPKVKQILNLH